MAVAYSTALRNARLDAITTAVGASGKLRIYDGTRPSSGGTATNLLAELTLGSTFAAAASGGVLTANAITGDTSADASGTATWWRVVTSGGTFVMDGDAGASGSGKELILDSTSIVETGEVDVTSFVITAGNA
jgi:alkylated DNA nucleotide flippase Atl1